MIDDSAWKILGGPWTLKVAAAAQGAAADIPRPRTLDAVASAVREFSA